MVQTLLTKISWWWNGLCPDCGGELDDEEHGYNLTYNHCDNCGYCTYIQRWTDKRGHNDV